MIVSIMYYHTTTTILLHYYYIVVMLENMHQITLIYIETSKTYMYYFILTKRASLVRLRRGWWIGGSGLVYDSLVYIIFVLVS